MQDFIPTIKRNLNVSLVWQGVIPLPLDPANVIRVKLDGQVIRELPVVLRVLWGLLLLSLEVLRVWNVQWITTNPVWVPVTANLALLDSVPQLGQLNAPLVLKNRIKININL